MAHRELVAALADGTLDPAAFGHAEHVQLGWYLLEAQRPAAAAARLSSVLRRYTSILGVPGKYHETVTLAWLFLIHDRRCQGEARDWPGFRRENPDLFDPAARPLARYYHPATLRDEVGRRAFLLPDAAASFRHAPRGARLSAAGAAGDSAQRQGPETQRGGRHQRLSGAAGTRDSVERQGPETQRSSSGAR
jgi:hypothetical protein